MNIKLIMVRSKDKVDITNLVESVTWSGDVNTLPRRLEVNYANSADIPGGKRIVGYSPGNMVIFYLDNKELFRGFIFKQSLNNDGKESFVAYDELIYATKNFDTLLVKNKAASDIIISQCKKFGIGVGSIAPTGYKIGKKLFEGQALSEIWDELLQLTANNTNKLYKIYSQQGKVYMVPRSNAQKVVLSADNVITASNEISIENLASQVLVTKGSLDSGETKFASVLEKDENAIKAFGTMQIIESADDKATAAGMKALAKSLLAKNKKPEWTASIDFIGHPLCITGYKLNIKDELSLLNSDYYITSDSHTFSNGVHKMNLQISNKLE